MSNDLQKPIIAVLGATGNQGGSVVRFLLDDPDVRFRIRAITRNVDSNKAKELASLPNVEVVQADLNDTASLTNAFKGAYGVFGVTNFWEKMVEAFEIQQGKNLVDAARNAGIKHFVWSTLDHTGNPRVPHWASKAIVDDYLKESGVPRTSLYTAFYYENFLDFLPFNNPPITETDGPIGGYSVADTGAYVVEAFKHPEEWIDKDMRICADIFTPRDIYKLVKELSGKDVPVKELSREEFDKLNQPPLEEIWANMKFFYNTEGNPGRDIELTKRIYPARQDVRGFVQANLDKLVQDMTATATGTQ